MKIILFIHFLARKGLSAGDVVVARGTGLQEIRPWASFKNVDFVK